MNVGCYISARPPPRAQRGDGVGPSRLKGKVDFKADLLLLVKTVLASISRQQDYCARENDAVDGSGTIDLKLSNKDFYMLRTVIGSTTSELLPA